jgi:Fur family transcriptional regulator, iron response regulator
MSALALPFFAFNRVILPKMSLTDTDSKDLPAMGQSQSANVIDLIKSSGLRPTRQRLALGGLLFAGEDRHVTAEQLHAEVVALGEHVSLATVYNTLHQFCRAGLVRELAIDGSKGYFDTNTSNHNHFLLEDTCELMDIPGDSIQVSGLPTPPEGTEIVHIDVIVRLAKN